MNTDKNNASQTLFRFVSQRNAQLIETEDKVSFINRPKSMESVFDEAIIQWSVQKLPNVSKIDALTAKARELKTGGQIRLLGSIAVLSEVTGGFYAAGRELAVSGKVPSDLERELTAYFTVDETGMAELTDDSALDLTNIWDNFIYQVVLQEDFYIKEALSQVLKAYNYIRHIAAGAGDRTEILTGAAGARIVLPPVLFLDEYPVEEDRAFRVNVSRIGSGYISAGKTAVSATAERMVMPASESNRQANYLSARYYKDSLQALKKELEKAKKSYVRAAGASRASYSSQPALSPTDPALLAKKLSPDALRTLALFTGIEGADEQTGPVLRSSAQEIPATEHTEDYGDLDGIIQHIDEYIADYESQLNANIALPRESYASFGGVLVPMASGDVESQKAFTLVTVAKSSSEWYVLLELNDKTRTIFSAGYRAISGDGSQIISDSSVQPVQDGIYKLFAGSSVPVAGFAENGFLIMGEITLSDNTVYRLDTPMTVNPSLAGKDAVTGAFPYSAGAALERLDINVAIDDFECLVCAESGDNPEGRISVHATLNIPDTSSVGGASYRLMNGGNVIKAGHISALARPVNNSVRLTSLFEDSLSLEELVQATRFELEATVDGNIRQLTIEGFNSLKCDVGMLKDTSVSGEGATDGQVFIPRGFGVRRLGIADYLKVEQNTHAYVEGEVAGIENIMAREYREKSTRRLRRNELTTSTSRETEQERLTDTTTATRFEMQSEIAKMLQESTDISVNSSVRFSAFKADFNIASSYANHRSKQESSMQARTQAQDITERALDRIVSKVRQERVEKILEEFEENNAHGFDNRKGDKHVVGVYRWVDKLMKNQIFNYGKRMMFEFMVPQPSNIHNLASSSVKTARVITKPVDPRTYSDAGKRLDSYEKVNADTLSFWGSMYSVDLMNLSEEISIGKAFSFEISGDSVDTAEWDEVKAENFMLPIPEGFEAYKAKVFSYGPEYKEEQTIGIFTLVGNHMFNTSSMLSYVEIGNFVDELPISYSQMGYHAGSINIDVKCRMTNVGRIKAYNAVISAYQEAMDAYNKAILEEEAKAADMKETNANFYRQIEQDVLKHNCIAYMVDPDLLGAQLYTVKDKSLETYEVIKKKMLDDYVALVKFMEQAFEWDVMSYNFYPYFWGNKADWTNLYQSESVDPLFRSFLQSGMARVVATVRPGFEDAVQFYMATGKIWSGGEVPVIGDPLYLSIVDEMREPTGEKYGKAWITRIPTSLTILQAESIGLQVGTALPHTDEDPAEFEDPGQLVTTGNFVISDSVMQSPDSGAVGNLEINNDYLQLTTKGEPKQVIAQLELDELKEALQ